MFPTRRTCKEPDVSTFALFTNTGFVSIGTKRISALTSLHAHDDVATMRSTLLESVLCSCRASVSPLQECSRKPTFVPRRSEHLWPRSRRSPVEEPTVPSWRTTGDSENFAYQQCLQRGPRTTTNMLETKQTRHVNLQATSFQPLRREVARHPSHRKLFDAENAWQRRKRDPPMCLAKLATVSNAQPVRFRSLRRRTLTSGQAREAHQSCTCTHSHDLFDGDAHTSQSRHSVAAPQIARFVQERCQAPCHCHIQSTDAQHTQRRLKPVGQAREAHQSCTCTHSHDCVRRRRTHNGQSRVFVTLGRSTADRTLRPGTLPGSVLQRSEICVSETQTATPERMSRVRCTRSAITATPATHSTRQRATRNAHANALENTREHKNTREHTARPNKPNSCSQHAKHDDTVHHVKGDFLGALRLCWDLRLRPDHPTVVTVRLRVRQCTGLKKLIKNLPTSWPFSSHERIGGPRVFGVCPR